MHYEPLRFDFTKCSEYDNFINNNLLDLKYNSSDARNSYNSHYEINWDENNRVMSVQMKNSADIYVFDHEHSNYNYGYNYKYGYKGKYTPMIYRNLHP